MTSTAIYSWHNGSQLPYPRFEKFSTKTHQIAHAVVGRLSGMLMVRKRMVLRLRN